MDQNSDAITAAAKMGSELIIFKTHSIFAVGYEFDGEEVYHPVRECHSTIGCDMPGSVQLIDNRLVFASTRSGVYMLISTNNALENIVKPISANINRLLMMENGLEDACSCDYARCYWLKAGTHIYLWDYETTPYTGYADYEQGAAAASHGTAGTASPRRNFAPVTIFSAARRMASCSLSIRKATSGRHIRRIFTPRRSISVHRIPERHSCLRTPAFRATVT